MVQEHLSPYGADLLRAVLRRQWSATTSFCRDWTPERPSYGQCAVTALKVQDLLGGELLRICLDDGESHYANRIDGKVYDLTADQFAYPLDYSQAQTRTSEQVLSNRTTAARYAELTARVDAALDAPLLVTDIEHLAIRDARFVAGTNERPEVGVFVQTRTRPPAISADKLAQGQQVWMKWKGGPVVASSRLLSWHAGVFSGGNVNEVRERCVGTSLFGLDAYWGSVAEKQSGAYCVLRLRDEEWLEAPVWSAERSYGSSWIYLDTLRKKLLWLTFGDPPRKEAQKGRAIPAGLRFKVLRRDGFACQYCGRKAPTVTLHVDHRVPWREVKRHDMENLVTACQDCNLGKGATAHPLGS